MDLELARADGHLDAVAFAAGACECLRDGGLRRPEEAEDVVLARRCARRARAARARSRAPAARGAAARAAGPAARRRRSSPCRARCPGAVPARPSESAPSGSVACLRTPGLEFAVRAPEAVGDRARDRPDRSLERPRRRRAARPATRATSSTVRSSCVGPRPPETRQRSAANASRNAALEVVDGVADDRDPLRLEPEANRLRGEERPVAVVPLAPDELRARDDDRRPGRGSSGGPGDPARGDDERRAGRQARPGCRSRAP